MKNSRGSRSQVNSNPSNLIDIKLKDGRRLYTTHNNFRHYVEDKKGNSTLVGYTYFKNCLKLPYLDEQ
jgi:hypothetical protein